MAVAPLQGGDKVRFEVQGLEDMFAALRRRGYQPVGPAVRQGDLLLEELSGVQDLARGWTDEQEGGAFRLKPREDQAFFGYGVGQDSWKKFLFPSELLLWQARRQGTGFEIIPETGATPKFAFIGVRSCDLHAMAVQDKVFMEGKFADPTYRSRREQALVVAVNCAGLVCGTGFCVSMQTGPKATFGFDVALTEVLAGGQHYFIAEVRTPMGAEILGEVPHRAARPPEIAQAEGLVEETARRQGRSLDTTDIKELFYRNYEHPRWDDVAARCLNCGNCTMVCPTCFCHTIEDYTDLTGQIAQRWRKLDVCFTLDFSYIHGGSIRATPRSRYRQWLTHKLATWIDQFGCSGCIGCGRCITWCPVAIDITEEARAIRASETSAPSSV
jgi:sulfhydrogenase subunit beta (sulfur reductase)